MLKSKVNLFTITLLIFVVLFIFTNKDFAKTNETTDWKVIITSDTKDLEKIQQINFKVEENEKVVNGKIAPGGKAIAKVEIDLSQALGNVDIQVLIDDSKLANTFLLTTKLNNEIYHSNQIRKISNNRENQIQELILELEWAGDNDEQDTIIGTTIDSINIPIKIVVSQHI